MTRPSDDSKFWNVAVSIIGFLLTMVVAIGAWNLKETVSLGRQIAGMEEKIGSFNHRETKIEEELVVLHGKIERVDDRVRRVEIEMQTRGR